MAMRQEAYIESPRHWKDMYSNAAVNGEWRPVDRIPVNRIRVDKSVLAFANDVDACQVNDMLKHFDQDLWIPVLVNQDFVLLDGQHRLAIAKKLRLRYVDVIVQEEDRLRLPAKRKRAIDLLRV